MTRTIGVVPVRIGRSVISVSVEAEAGASTHVDVLPTGARIILAEDLSPDIASREVESVLPEVHKLLGRKLLN